jgi:D-alanine-D-alanine ligase
MKKLKIGVLMGGRSRECDVSLSSGRTFCDHLDAVRFECVPLFLTTDGLLYQLPYRFLHRGKISDFFDRLAGEATRIAWDDLKNYVDFIYIALHGRYGEDGRMQALLTVLGIPYGCSKIWASAIGMDKHRQKAFLHNAGIITPRSILVSASQIKNGSLDAIIQELANNNLAFPLVIKPRYEGSSLGVCVVDTESELLPSLLQAASCGSLRPDSTIKLEDVLIEEYINGMEFSCIALEREDGSFESFIPTEIERAKDGFFDYTQKYMPGRAKKHTPARCSSETIGKMQQAVAQTAYALGFATLARVDGFVRENGEIVIIDPNTLSGMTPSSFVFLQAAHAGLSHTMLINHLLDIDLKRYGMIEKIGINQNENNSKIKRMRVGVLLGGRSHEREISLESGRNIVYKLSPASYDVTPLFLSQDLKLYPINQAQLALNSTEEIAESIEKSKGVAWNDLSKLFDFIFIGLHGGEGENGTIQGLLEEFDIPYNGSSIATSALCMNKYATNEFLRSVNIDVPKSVLVSLDTCANFDQDTFEKLLADNGIRYPFIVKPHDDGCSMGVSKVSSWDNFPRAIANICAIGKQTVMIEEFIDGIELTVGAFGNTADEVIVLPASQVVSGCDILSIEEKFLIGAGENQTPARVPAHVHALIQHVIKQVYIALDCSGYARIDCFYQTAQQSSTGIERIVIIEPNTLPGLTPATCIFHQAAEIGISPMQFLDTIIKLGVIYHRGESISPVDK